jgi:hypothetical protein
MTKRCLSIIGSLAAWLVGLAIVMMISLNGLSVPPWGNPSGNELSPEVAGDARVGQRFIAPLPGLDRIDLWLARSSATDSNGVFFHLMSGDAAAGDLWSAAIDSDDIHDGTPYRFEFPRIPDSEGRSFSFYLESPESRSGDAIAVRYDSQAMLEGASAFVDNLPLDGNLRFQTFYQVGPLAKLDLLLDSLAEGKPYLLGTKGFYIGLGIVYALILGIFVYQIAQIILVEPGEGT